MFNMKGWFYKLEFQKNDRLLNISLTVIKH